MRERGRTETGAGTGPAMALPTESAATEAAMNLNCIFAEE